MENNYKNLFDNNLNKSINSPELCGFEICSIPINLLRYFYYQCMEAN